MADSSENIVLITIDSLRRDHCGFMGYGRETTPFLNGLDAFIAERCYSNGTASAQAFRSILTSTYPLEFRDYDQLAPQRPYIADLLSDTDIESYGFNAQNPYVSRHTAFDRNFDHFYDFLSESGGEGGSSSRVTDFLERKTPKLYEVLKQGYSDSRARAAKRTVQGWNPPYIPAKKVVDEVVDTVEYNEGGTFLWVQFMDVHLPHFPYQDYDGQFIDLSSKFATYSNFKSAVKGHKETLIDCYDESIRYVDSQIQRLTNELESILGECHVFVTNDHGELFGEHSAGIGHPHEHIYPEQVAAPLLIKSPRADRFKRNELSLLNHLDILPTILDIYDIQPPNSVQGESLSGDISRDYVISETCPYDQDQFELQYDQHKIALITDDDFYVDVYDAEAESLPNFEGSRKHIYDNMTSVPPKQLASVIDQHREDLHFTTSMDDIFNRIES